MHTITVPLVKSGYLTAGNQHSVFFWRNYLSVSLLQHHSAFEHEIKEAVILPNNITVLPSAGLLAITCREDLGRFAAYTTIFLPCCNHLQQYHPHITVIIVALLLSLSRGK